MTDREFLRLLGRNYTRRAAIYLLRRAELQSCGDDGMPRLLHQLRKATGCDAYQLATHAYDEANPDLGNGWRHRYCRAATWLTAQYRQRLLELAAPTADQVREKRRRAA